MFECLELAQRLIRCPSITPQQAGCLDILAEILTKMGFNCQRLPFGDVDNLYARLGTNSPNICFAGHVDVVPVFQEQLWSHPPFAGIVADEVLYGRGAVDMKGAIAAFITAVANFLQEQAWHGSISLLLTSDEEGPATNGTVRVLRALQDQGETLSFCIVGEPSSTTFVGDTIKIGRRGSLNIEIVAHGSSGHVAYPHLAKNPITVLLEFLKRITSVYLDTGCPDFDPSHLEVVSIDVGNTTYNVIPGQASARINIRFNPLHTAYSLMEWLKLQAGDLAIQLTPNGTASSFYGNPDSTLTNCLQRAIMHVTGRQPALSTSGGTSDARFIKDMCPVIECGLINLTAHQIDEHVTLKDLSTLQQIYQQTLKNILVNPIDTLPAGDLKKSITRL